LTTHAFNHAAHVETAFFSANDTDERSMVIVHSKGTWCKGCLLPLSPPTSAWPSANQHCRRTRQLPTSRKDARPKVSSALQEGEGPGTCGWPRAARIILPLIRSEATNVVLGLSVAHLGMLVYALDIGTLNPQYTKVPSKQISTVFGLASRNLGKNILGFRRLFAMRDVILDQLPGDRRLLWEGGRLPS